MTRDPVRSLGWLALVLAMVSTTDVARARLRDVQKTRADSRYAPTQYVPMYPGDNEIRIHGSEVRHAIAVQLPPGTAERVALVSKALDSSGIGELTVSVRIEKAVHGKLVAQVLYPGGKAPDTFKVRVYRRGTVQAIVAPSEAKIGAPITVRFTGRDFGVAALRDGGPFYSVERVRGSDSSAESRLVFHQCGSLRLGEDLLHDAHVPFSEVMSGDASYRGRARATVVVGPAPGARCPSPLAPSPSQLPFCPVGKRWNDTKRSCVGK